MKRASVVSTLVSIFLLGSCSGGGDRNEESFTNGGMTLIATTSSDSTNKTVTVTDTGDTKVLTLVVSRTGATLSAPGENDISMTFYSTLEDLPTDYTANRMAIYVAGIRALNSGTAAMPDSPGCDWFYDSQCTLDCCAKHDQCYRENNCDASTWLWGFLPFACTRCNNIVYNCIVAACAGVIKSGLPDNCYDAECNMHYDCPPDYDNCTCKDICADSGLTIPATCGDGQCTTGEDTTNCWNDCVFGKPVTAPEDPGFVTCPNEFVSAETGTWPLESQWADAPACCPLVPVYNYYCRYGPRPAGLGATYPEGFAFVLRWATEPRKTLGCGSPPDNPSEDVISATHSAEVSHASVPKHPAFHNELRAFATQFLGVLEQGVDASGNKVLPAGAALCE